MSKKHDIVLWWKWKFEIVFQDRKDYDGNDNEVRTTSPVPNDSSNLHKSYMCQNGSNMSFYNSEFSLKVSNF